jgi:acetolactate synthase I/II/III large subunit
MSNGPTTSVKYAEVVMGWLQDLGYTHCFFVAGGNIMHLLDGARKTMTCIPTVHEVTAGIAAEYFNESEGEGRAFALVTAGPGVSNILTAMSGAWLESRELLVLAGQVKSSDLAGPTLRQRGIQEIDGVALARSVSVNAECITEPLARSEFTKSVLNGRRGRPGPTFIEFCLDTQGAPVLQSDLDDGPCDESVGPAKPLITSADNHVEQVFQLTKNAKRPVWLIGGGVSRETSNLIKNHLLLTGIPLMTTWNGADRIPDDAPTYFGRPNTWGQRSANILLAQADLVVAFGTRLGLQQTGFNFKEFAPCATLVQVDIDKNELSKGHPNVDFPLEADANQLLSQLVQRKYPDYSSWLDFCRQVTSLLPVREDVNETGEGFVCPYNFYLDLSDLTKPDDLLIPCSSGGANSVAMQTIKQKWGQTIITDKGLASMGYGLAGAIGGALGHPNQRTFLIEGDGGFAQNLQELATVVVNKLNLKIFLFCNNGYGSIRMTQKNYFDGAYLGCDTETGLGFPDWNKLCEAYGLPSMNLDKNWATNPTVLTALDQTGPHCFIVPIDPLQTYWPKITSRITETGTMESNPLHQMSPDLDPEIAQFVYRYL